MIQHESPTGSRIGCFVAAAVLLALIAYVVYGMRRDARLERDFGRIAVGASAESAVRLLGTPSWRSPCQSRFPYGADKDCAEEIVYASSFAPLNPTYWTIQVGHGGRELRADQISSP